MKTSRIVKKNYILLGLCLLALHTVAKGPTHLPTVATPIHHSVLKPENHDGHFLPLSFPAFSKCSNSFRFQNAPRGILLQLKIGTMHILGLCRVLKPHGAFNATQSSCIQ